MDKEKLPWRSFVDLGNAGAGEIATKWNHSATPTFYVIDHKGIIRYKWAAPPGTKVMDAALEEVIGEAEKDAKKPPNRRHRGGRVVTRSLAPEVTAAAPVGVEFRPAGIAAACRVSTPRDPARPVLPLVRV